MKEKDKLAVYLTPEKKAELERRCHEDGSKSMTEFIRRALDFYLGYLDAQDAGIFLPAAIRSCIDGRLGTMENRMASLLFKLAVENDMTMSMMAETLQVSEEYVREQRAHSVQNVKRPTESCALSRSPASTTRMRMTTNGSTDRQESVHQVRR